MQKLLNNSKHLSKKMLNLLLPPRCISCKTLVESPGQICGDCWQELRFITAPQCAQCGTPFPYEVEEGTLCLSCTANPPDYDQARAVLRYDNASRRLITRFKYSDHTHAVESYARMMQRLLSALTIEPEKTLICPVPLHPLRMIQRRYNQSALLASALATLKNLAYHPDILKRIRHTPPQASLNRNARLTNVKGCFALNKRRLDEVKGRHILLVDDVMTTGATINECTRILKKAGAERVSVITLARTVEVE